MTEGAMPGQLAAQSGAIAVPALLRHLYSLTASFEVDGRRIPYIRIYAHPAEAHSDRRSATRRLTPTLDFVVAHESGFEGIACVDDVARAVILALQVHEQLRSDEALTLAHWWLSFVVYMQDESGYFVNFIADERGMPNYTGRTSRAGGLWWNARALWALATAWRVTRNPLYHAALQRGHVAVTGDMKIVALHALALMELYRAAPNSTLAAQICRLCDTIVGTGQDYFRDMEGQDSVAMWGYHQLQAVAQAGQLLARSDYLAACERTVYALIDPVIAGGFYHEYPQQRDHQCAYDLSPLVLGLEALYGASGQERWRARALACTEWLEGRNPSGQVLYDAETGRCSDGITTGVASFNCGAESSIEAGFIELAGRRLAAASRVATLAGDRR